MLLKNVNLVYGADGVTIRVSDNQIKSTGKDLSPQIGEPVITFDNALAFPGLINSHDHLDLNLFPQLGKRKYTNYTEWDKSIHQQFGNEIAAILKIPVELREDWGIIKNLICGVTTVVNHGKKIKTANKVIRVFESCQCLHSPGFEKLWKIKLNNPIGRKIPVVIHVGEGTNDKAHHEIDQLIHWNLLKRKLVGVHGVAMSPRQAKKFKALVWCPQSNFFLLDKTAPVDQLKTRTTILFGTDSTRTSGWDIWNHIRQARETGLLTDNELFDALNSSAAVAWKLPTGKINPSRKADIAITRMKDGENKPEGWFSTRPEDILMVMRGGTIELFDEELLPQLQDLDKTLYSKIRINGSVKYVYYDVPKLINDIKQHYPEAKFPIELCQAI